MANKSVFCLARDQMQAEQIVDNLKNAGYSNNDISVLLPDRGSTREFAHEKGTKAPEGAATGAGTGGVIGGVLGWLVGMGIPEYEAKRYEARLREGRVLLSVHCDDSDQVKQVKNIFKNAGAEDIASAGEKSVSDKDRSGSPSDDERGYRRAA